MSIDLSALSLLFPGLALDRVRLGDGARLLEAHAAAPHACCPTWHEPSLRVHSHYLRTPRDLPISNHTVCVRLSVRRFFCEHACCPQRTFAEHFPELLPGRAQRTTRFSRPVWPKKRRVSERR